jgi:hypothetical protein
MTLLPSADHTSDGDREHYRHQLAPALAALIIVAITVVSGAILGYLIGPPKAFASIAAVMILWAVVGWPLGGWRMVLAGLTVLTAALSASDAAYALAVAMCGLSLIFLFFTYTDITSSK